MNLRNVKQVHASTRRNRLAQVLVTAAVVVLAHLAYGVDAAGGRTTLEEAHSGWNTTNVSAKTYEYDPENRLIGVNGGQVQIAYDGDGHRVSKTVPTAGGGSKTTYYLVDDLNPTGHAQVLEEWEASGTEPPRLVRNYAHGLDLISARDSSDGRGEATTHYYGHDGHGSVRFLTGEAGTAVSDTYTYDAYGVLLAQTPADANTRTPNNYLYAGEEWDHDLGLYYNRARYMDPNLGRFWTMDTFEGHQSDPLSLHKYTYADANPVNRIDPTGLFTDPVSTLSSATWQLGIRTRNAAAVQARNKAARTRLANTIAVMALVAIQILPLGELEVHPERESLPVASRTNEDEDNAELFRSMKEEAALPLIGDTARTLGVRPGAPPDGDILIGLDGMVRPNSGGMSVAPRTPFNLPAIRRPRLLLGTGKDPVWGIHREVLGPELLVDQDTPTHATVQPARAMSIINYRRALAETRERWLKVVPGN